MNIVYLILSHGRPRLTIRCIENLLLHDVKNIIIFDNGSNDEDFSVLNNSVVKKISIIKNGENLGITLGRIELAKLAISRGFDRLVFLDNDQFPSRHAVDKYISKKSGVLLGAEAWSMNDDFRPIKPISKNEEKFTYIGCGGMCVDSDAWTRIGGFDHQFSPYYFEDPDFCLRAKDLNYSFDVMRPDLVFHEAHGTLGLKKDRMTVFYKNYLRFKDKWKDRKDLLQQGVAKWD